MITQLLTPMPADHTQKVLCCYMNGTTKAIAVKINNVPDWHFEGIVFPNERFLFEAPSTAKLEVYQFTEFGITRSDLIPCNDLLVEQIDSTSRTRESTCH